jgi:hypothetical protein
MTRKRIEEKEIADLNEDQKEILLERVKGTIRIPKICENTGNKTGKVQRTLALYFPLISDIIDSNEEMAADGGFESQPESQSEDRSVELTIECNCGETHEVNIK